MTTVKAFTDIEQSRKLAEILPLESADMFYSDILFIDRKHKYSFHYLETYGFKTFEDTKQKESKHLSFLPCWSLAALFQVLPLGIYDEFDDCNYELKINMIDKMPRYIRLGDIFHSQFPYDFEKDSLLDNIVESIIWLNDNNYFEL